MILEKEQEEALEKLQLVRKLSRKREQFVPSVLSIVDEVLIAFGKKTDTRNISVEELQELYDRSVYPAE